MRRSGSSAVVRRPRPWRRTVALPLLFTWGCYTYVPIDRAKPVPATGREVRVELAEPRDVQTSDLLVRDVGTVEGRLLPADGDSLLLYVTRVWSGSGFQHDGGHRRLALAAEQVRRLEEKRLAGAKTGTLIGLGLAAATAIVILVVEPGSGQGSSNGGNGDGKPLNIVPPR